MNHAKLQWQVKVTGSENILYILLIHLAIEGRMVPGGGLGDQKTLVLGRFWRICSRLSGSLSNHQGSLQSGQSHAIGLQGDPDQTGPDKLRESHKLMNWTSQECAE